MTQIRVPRRVHSKKPINPNLAEQIRQADAIRRYAQNVHANGRPGISSAHDSRHVTTVANYAERIAQHFGASTSEQTLASIAGHTHDRIRIKSEKLIGKRQAIEILAREFPEGFKKKTIKQLVENAFTERKKQQGAIADYGPRTQGRGITSDELTAVFLKDKLTKRLGTNATKRVLHAIRLAGKMPSKSAYRRNLVHSALVYADKFFEANGAFIAFRRAYFMGEREDKRREMRAQGWNPKEAAIRITLDETNKRITAYSNLSKIPRVLHPFVKYQVAWQHRLREGLEKREEWAVHLAETLFRERLKEKPRSLEQTIREYKPIAKEDREFKQETLRYFNGELWDTFVRLVRK